MNSGATAPPISPAAVANQQIDNGIIHISRSIAEHAISEEKRMMEIRYKTHPPDKNAGMPWRKPE